jgi:glucokinase-like ROK family protein
MFIVQTKRQTKASGMNYWDNEIMTTLNGYELKTYLNKKRIIKYLYRQSEMSGTDISKIFHISIPTTLTYLKELVEEGFIESRGKGDSLGGRRPTKYGLKRNSVYVIGVDIRRKGISLAIFNGNMEKVNGIKLPSVNLNDKTSIVSLITSHVDQMIQQIGIDYSKVMGVGINMPGLINSEKGINYTYLYNPDETFTQLFHNHFKCPVFLENDTKARTLAEMRYGEAKDSNNALVLQIDWGLGLGMILNRKLYKGNSGFAGEFSHIPIDENGVLCNCGKVGCLETIASGNALVRLTMQGLEVNKNSKLFPIFNKNREDITTSLIVKMALEGDQFAISMINQVGLSLGKGLSYLIQILNPELIIISGSLSEAGNYLILSIQQALQKHCLPKLLEGIKIKISPLGEDVGVIGSATVVLESIIES